MLDAQHSDEIALHLEGNRDLRPGALAVSVSERQFCRVRNQHDLASLSRLSGRALAERGSCHRFRRRSG